MEQKPHRRSALDNILAIDRELINLTLRRSHILRNMRKGKEKGSSARMLVEKRLREEWERNAEKLSRDPQLVRALFNVLQAIEAPQFLDAAQAQEMLEFSNDTRRLDTAALKPVSSFALAPAAKPVDIAMPGAPSRQGAALVMTLAAAFGAPCRIGTVMLGDGLSDLLKALRQTGADMAFSAETGMVTAAGGRASLAGTVIYVGDEPLNFYLLSALGLRDVGKMKFTGGAALKGADFSAWRGLLPQCGARLASLIPKANGLPVHQECSALFAPEIRLAPDLPREAVFALAGTSPVWGSPVLFRGDEHPAFDETLDELSPYLRAFGVAFKREKGGVRIEPGAQLPDEPRLPLDALLTSMFLAFPVMAGGRAALSGQWDAHCPEARNLKTLFEACGATLAVSGLGIECRAGLPLKEAAAKGDINVRRLADAVRTLDERFTPLGLVLLAGAAAGAGSAPLVCAQRSGCDAGLAEDFLGRLGFALANAETIMPRPDALTAPDRTWTSPDAVWAMAFSLGAYLRPGVRLTNPGIVKDVLPAYWNFFNSLPVPTFEPRPKAAPPEKRRRRIIAAQEGAWPEEKEEE